jgi:hypothetical protein
MVHGVISNINNNLNTTKVKANACHGQLKQLNKLSTHNTIARTMEIVLRKMRIPSGTDGRLNSQHIQALQLIDQVTEVAPDRKLIHTVSPWRLFSTVLKYVKTYHSKLQDDMAQCRANEQKAVDDADEYSGYMIEMKGMLKVTPRNPETYNIDRVDA